MVLHDEVVLEDHLGCLLVNEPERVEVEDVADDLSSVVWMDPLMISEQDRTDLSPDLIIVVNSVVTCRG